MASVGWRLAATSDRMIKDSDKSSWFFCRRTGEEVALPGLLCISLNSADKICVIGGSAEARARAVKAVHLAGAHRLAKGGPEGRGEAARHPVVYRCGGALLALAAVPRRH